MPLLRAHIPKEDDVLFPMAARLLDPAELEELDRCGQMLPAARI